MRNENKIINIGHETRIWNENIKDEKEKKYII